MTDWLDDLFNEAENESDAEFKTRQYVESLIHKSNYSKTRIYELLNYPWAMEFAFKEVPELVRRLKLDQKSPFDYDMPNKIGDVARLSNERKKIDDCPL